MEATVGPTVLALLLNLGTVAAQFDQSRAPTAFLSISI